MATYFIQLPSDENRIATLEGKRVRSTRFASISSGTSGTVTLPSGASVILDDFGGTVDAVVSTLSGGRPTFSAATTSGGAVVSTTFDASGNYVLSGSPSSYPVALVYRVYQTLANFTSIDSDIIGEWDIDDTGAGAAAIAITDEGVALTATVASIDFVGAGVTATNVGTAVTVTIPGGGSASISDTAYNAGTWDGDTTTAPSKNAVRDKIETLQPLDATLTSLAAYNTNGLLTQTAADTFTGRTLTGPAAGITITNGSGVAGNPTLALANDLSALEALASTGLAVRTAADTWAQRTITAPAAGIIVSNGDGVSGNPTLALANDLSAVEGLAANGMAARTATDTWTVRTITGTTNRIGITNGDGVSGNPTLDIGSDVVTLTGSQVLTNKTLTTPIISSISNTGTVTLPTATDTLVGRATTDTLTNKRITKRITTAADATSVTPNTDSADVTYQLNTQSTGTLTINADSGTPTNAQAWLFKIKSTNVQTFSWNAVFAGGTVALPTASTGSSKIDYFSFIYDTVNTKWHFTGTAPGF